MTMVTKCPGCTTTFRVTARELQAHNGDVRCGRCGVVFNAFDSLTTLPEPLASARDSGADPTPVHGSEAAPAGGRLAGTAGGTAVAGGGSGSLSEPGLLEAAPRASRSRWLWGAGSLLLALLFAAQAAYFFRTGLAVLFPGFKPYLESACRALGCTVSLPRKADLLAIDSSDLRADPQHPGIMALTAALRNRAPFPQAYPYLELTLTDVQDEPLARRVLLPREYLARNPGPGIGPSQEVSVKLYLDVGDLKAAGYRLYLFYP